MTRTWKSFGLLTMLAGLLAVAAPLALAQDPPTTAEKIDGIQADVRAMKKNLETVQAALDRLSAIERDLKELRTLSSLDLQSARADIDSLRTQITRLRTDMDALRDRLSNPTRVAGYPPNPATPVSGMGRVELWNTFPQEEVVVVNNRAYHVLPNQRVLSEPFPAGQFTYEVLGVTPPRTGNVPPDKVWTVYIHPLP
jgi:hypothetical protein